MRWPWQNRLDYSQYPVRRKNKPKDPLTKERDLEFKRKVYAHERFLEEVDHLDPESKREIICQILGYKYKPKVERTLEDRIYEEALEEDPQYKEEVKKARLDAIRGKSNKDALDDKVDSLAIEKLQSSPELLASIVDKKVRKLLDGKSSSGGIAQLLQELDAYDELKDRLGGNESKDSGVGGQILGQLIQNLPTILPLLLGKDSSSKQKVYVIETPDGSKEVSPEEYSRYKSTRLLPEAVNHPPVKSEAVESVVEKPSETKTVEETEAPKAVSLDIKTWMMYLGENPYVLAEILKEKASYEDEEGKKVKVILSFLRTQTADSLLKLLSKFKESEDKETVDAIIQLEWHKEWLTEFLAIVKKESSESEALIV